MLQFSYADIIELARTEPEKKLRLMWKGAITGGEPVTPTSIMKSVDDGSFTAQQFDANGVCISEQEWRHECLKERMD